jgi:hypothetical protein
MTMTPEEHQQAHKLLHRALDELLGCYINETSSLGLKRCGSIQNPIVELLQWAHEKTMLPSPADAHSSDQRDRFDFEGQRQMIVLALAELALSRPGWDESIREIVRHYDAEGLPMFEGFKRSNADRVSAERGPL